MTDYKSVCKYVFVILLTIAVCRLTKGWAAPAIVLIAVGAAFMRKTSVAILCTLLLLFIVLISDVITGGQRIIMVSDRAWIVLSGMLLPLVVRGRSERPYIKFVGLFAYFLYMFLPSSVGYCWNVSYFKLVFMILFLLSLVFSEKAISMQIDLPAKMRSFILAICIVLVLGSLCSLPFPAIAYPQNSQWLFREGMDIDAVNSVMRASAAADDMRLFAGITIHSQMFASMLALVFGFLLCDMLFVERRITKMHISLMLFTLVFAYMTRSRTAFVAIAASVCGLAVVVFRRTGMPVWLIRKLKIALSTIIAFLVIAAVAFEISSGTISKWLYKGVDRREEALSAMTSSRMLAVEEMMADFKSNPFLGCGFQVNRESARFADSLMVISAPVEKGVTPLVILSEGGIVGSLIVVAFLIAFFPGCFRMKYYSVIILFISFFAVNLGESVLFSPGGVGGFLWAITIIGGVSIDLCGRTTMYPWMQRV